MSKPLVTIKPHITVTGAARLMIRRKVKKLIVKNGDRLLDIVTLPDLIPLLRNGGSIKRLPLKNAAKRVKRIFGMYTIQKDGYARDAQS
jgi:CBS-domain-containing membrane protein